MALPSVSNRAIRSAPSMVETCFRLLDAAGILVGWSLATVGTGWPTERFWVVGLLAVAVFWTVASFSNLYRSWRGSSAHREIICSLVTWSITLGVLLTIGLLTRFMDDVARSTWLTWFLAAPALMGAGRLSLRHILRSLRSNGWNRRNVAIVGVTELGIQLSRALEESPEYGLSVVGFFDDRPPQRTIELDDQDRQHVGNLRELTEMARKGDVDAIYITFPMRAERRIQQVLHRMSDSTASVYIVPDFFVFELLHSRWSELGGLPVVGVFEHPFYGVDGMLKRLFDLLLAGTVLLLASPLLVTIALGIKWTSPGPVFFRQKRYGLDGREIRVWKFRSMKVCEDGAQIRQASRQDSRVTKFGGFLRRTSLDELPQLFNVLEGSMSLVGPRPHANAHNEQYRKMIRGYMLRHKVRPGITGLAQVNGWRGETDTLEKMERRVEFDHRYIREWSLWLDVKILFLTAFTVFLHRNAY